MYMTNYMETAVLNLFRGISITAPQKVYMALFLSNPGESGTGTEANYTGYSRVEVSFSTPAVMSGGRNGNSYRGDGFFIRREYVGIRAFDRFAFY